MPYTTEAAVRAASGFSNTTNITTATITAYLSDADSVINSKIGDRYALPLAVSGTSVTPEVIEAIARHITVGLLYGNEYGEESQDTDKGWQERLEFAMSMLDRIQSGEMKLYNSSGVELDISSLRTPVFYPTEISSDPNTRNNTDSKITMNGKF